MSSERTIVTRHEGLVQWLAARGITGKVVSHVTPEDYHLIEGKDVFGVLPLHLACRCASVTEVALPRMPADRRAFELSPKEMDSFGAELVTYKVTREVPADQTV